MGKRFWTKGAWVDELGEGGGFESCGGAGGLLLLSSPFCRGRRYFWPRGWLPIDGGGRLARWFAKYWGGAGVSQGPE